MFFLLFALSIHWSLLLHVLCFQLLLVFRYNYMLLYIFFHMRFWLGFFLHHMCVYCLTLFHLLLHFHGMLLDMLLGSILHIMLCFLLGYNFLLFHLLLLHLFPILQMCSLFCLLVVSLHFLVSSLHIMLLFLLLLLLGLLLLLHLHMILLLHLLLPIH